MIVLLSSSMAAQELIFTMVAMLGLLWLCAAAIAGLMYGGMGHASPHLR